MKYWLALLTTALVTLVMIAGSMAAVRFGFDDNWTDVALGRGTNIAMAAGLILVLLWHQKVIGRKAEARSRYDWLLLQGVAVFASGAGVYLFYNFESLMDGLGAVWGPLALIAFAAFLGLIVMDRESKTGGTATGRLPAVRTKLQSGALSTRPGQFYDERS